MSYSPSTNPPHAITEGGLQADLAKLWIYTGTDSDLSGTFFTDGQTRGIRVNDLIIGIDTNGNTVKLYRCTAVAALDAAHPYAVRSATLAAGYQIGN